MLDYFLDSKKITRLTKFSARNAKKFADFVCNYVTCEIMLSKMVTISMRNTNIYKICKLTEHIFNTLYMQYFTTKLGIYTNFTNHD